MKSKSEIAGEIFGKGFNCAQAVFSSRCREFGLPEETAKKIACGFGSGISSTSEVCGAVTGAVMLIGLKYGKFLEEDKESKDRTYKIVSQFISKFREELGSINCTELLKYDLSKEGELQKARESGIFKELCPVLVKKSVEFLEQFL